MSSSAHLRYVVKLTGMISVAVLTSLSGGSPSQAAGTFVYVSNADDGDITTYTMSPDGALQPGARVKAAPVVMPMVVSPDRRFLYAASRSKPYAVHAYTIDRATGALTLLASSPLVDSFPFISLDRTGRFLFGASYGGNLISVNAVGPDGRVAADPRQIIAIGRNAHSIRVDATNTFVFVPTLGTDQIFEFTFNASSGFLSSSTPPLLQLKAGTGPRHLVFSQDNRFVYVLSELLATVTTLSLDPKTGLLTEVASASGLPANSTLRPGAPRGAVGDPNAVPRNTDNDIWAADLHLTPDGRLLYISERTSSSLSGFRVDAATGTLTYLGTTSTEKQPRGFAIDPSGKFLVAAGEKSPTISVYAIDAASGGLRLLHQHPTGKGANWVEIVAFD